MTDYGIEDTGKATRKPHRGPWLGLLAAVVLVALAVAFLRLTRGPSAASPGAPVRQVDLDTVTPAPRVIEAAADVPGDAASAPDVVALAKEAAELDKQSSPLAAREKYLAALESVGTNAALRAEIEGRLGELNLRLVTTRSPMPEKVTHTVQTNDFLQGIAARYGTTTELIRRSNNLRDVNRILLGRRLLVLSVPFRIEVSKSRHDLLLRLGDSFFKRYPVATGVGDMTPAGSYAIKDRAVNPTWYPADGRVIPFGDPQNILGTRWLGLRAAGEGGVSDGLGIHGTWDDTLIGKSASSGCVRMRNADIEELFALLPIGTPVTIME